MAYIACYAAAVREDRKAEFAAHAARAAEVFRDHGASRVVDCWGAAVPPGEVTSFPLAVRAEPGETVVMGWQEWPDKAAHDAAMPAAMQDPRMRRMGEMPFDGKRLIHAGFETLTDS